MVGYLEIIDDRQRTFVVLAGQEVVIERARFGRHIQMLRLAKTFMDELGAGSATQAANACQEYLCLATNDEPLLAAATGVELLAAARQLILMNDWRAVAAWLDPARNKATSSPLPAYHYQDRFWSTWVHTIASRYGWSRDEIFALWPEEAAYYMPEIQVSEFAEREDERALSEVSYKYDKSSKLSRFVPSPKPSWMVDQTLPPTQRIPRANMPVGVVIVEEQE